MLFRLLVAVALLLFALPVMAETYKWVDKKGTVNFTDDYYSIPQKYRKKARLLGDVDAAPAETPDAKGEPLVKEEKKGGKKGVEQPAEKKSTYGGRDAEAWKGEYAKLNAQINATQEAINDRQAKLSDTSKMSRSQYLSIQYELKNLESKLADLQGKLNSLNDAARKAGAPTELRQ